MSDNIDSILERFPRNRKDLLIPLLQEVQKDLGYLNDDAVERIGRHLSLPVNKIYSVAAFYDNFRFRPVGKFHIQVCHGTTCHIFGSTTYLAEMERQLKVKAGSTSRDKRYSIELVSCLGACEQSPVIRINDTYYSHVTPEDLTRIIRQIKEKAE